MSQFDDLQQFMAWWMANRPLSVPAKNALSFYDKATGIVVYRQPPFQVQLFIAHPGQRLVEHTHPNVDSFEVWIHGMEFTHNGNVMIDLCKAAEVGANGLPVAYGTPIRVHTNDVHGGVAGPNGGAFLSVQKWLNGIEPSCVAADWGGEPMDEGHAQQITTGETP